MRRSYLIEEPFNEMLIFVKTDDYTIQLSELGNSFRMNSSDEKTFTLPSFSQAEDGKILEICKLGSGKLNINAVGSTKITWESSSPGKMFNNMSFELGAFVRLEYVYTIDTLIIIGASGTWGID